MPILRFPHRLPVLLAVVAILLPASARGQKPPRKERDVISRDELIEADVKMPDLFQAVTRLRPHFLTQNRGPRTTGIEPSSPGYPMCNERLEPNCAARVGGNVVVKPVIYVDGTKAGDADVLRGIRTGDVEEVRYLSANKAAMDYGLGHEGGAILVTLRKATKP